VGATSLGATLAAGVGVGIFSSLSEAMRLVSVDREEYPIPEMMDAYAPYYDFYCSLYPILQERFAALAHL
jgi:sugar (pentulose or hexulose) kinase